MNDRQNFALKIIISFFACFIAATLVFLFLPKEYVFYRKLSDASFVAAVLNISLSVLMWISKNSGFDFITYVFYRFTGIVTKRKDTLSYTEYARTKHEKEGFFSFVIIIPGLIFFVLAVIFAVLC